MRIGIYFGSFNPPHRGHIRIARSLIKKELVDRLIIVPTGNYWEKQDLLAIPHRIKMLQMFEDEKISIDTTHNELVKTYMLMRAMKKDHPNDAIYFIVGADSLIRFEEWVNYKELLQYPFIIAKRDDLNKKEIKGYMDKWEKDDYQIIDIPKIDISSSEIREHMGEYPLIKKMLYRCTYDYLIKNQLFKKDS